MGRKFIVPGISGTSIILEEDGLSWKNKRYVWSEVLCVKRDDDAVATFVRYPSSSILFSDGQILRVPTMIKSEDTKRDWNITIFASRADYDDIMETILSKTKTNQTYEHLLYSCNYIIIYRWLIIVGSLFCLLSFLQFAAFKAKVEFMSLYFVFIALTSLSIGGYLLAKRRNAESAISQTINDNTRKGVGSGSK